MDERRELIYLAALLHDIGKFYQRAERVLLIYSPSSLIILKT